MEKTLLEHIWKTERSLETFKKGRLCLTSLVDFCDGVTASVHKGRAMAVIYLDISEAFDVILHNILAVRLERCGLDILFWFRLG